MHQLLSVFSKAVVVIWSYLNKLKDWEASFFNRVQKLDSSFLSVCFKYGGLYGPQRAVEKTNNNTNLLILSAHSNVKWLNWNTPWNCHHERCLNGSVCTNYIYENCFKQSKIAEVPRLKLKIHEKKKLTLNKVSHDSTLSNIWTNIGYTQPRWMADYRGQENCSYVSVFSGWF